jgi:hypothetical protein
MAKGDKEKDGERYKIAATNRKAYHDYAIEEAFEAGIVLRGTEVKSIREGRVNLQDSFAAIKDGEGPDALTQAVAASEGNQQAHGADPAEGAHDRPAQDLFQQARASEGGDRTRQGQEALRPAGVDQVA